MKKRFLLVMLVLFSLFFIAACEEKPTPTPPGPDSDDTVEQFTVTFDSQGGTLFDHVKVDKGAKVANPGAPTKDEYTFEFWYLVEGVAYNFDTPVTANITLKALWKKVEDKEEPPVVILEFLVVFGDPSNTVKVKEGELVPEPEALSQNGRTIIGWYLEPTYETLFSFDTPITEDLFLFAKLGHSYQELIEIGSSLSDAQLTAEEYYITGEIKSINNPLYGNLTITNGTDDFPVYGIKQGETLYGNLDYVPAIGDTITIKGKMKNFKGTLEFNETQLINFLKQEIPDVELSSITEARLLNEDELVKVTGVVAQITFANGGGRNGFYLVDDSASIYVYDQLIASQVEIGHTITILGTKTNYILATEQNQAEKHSYQGSIQISKPLLLEHNKEVTEYSQMGILKATIKEMINTPPSNNITNQIYKVHGYINKVIGTGFTNYYLNDLDGMTGSYVYTQCNGSDFAWLDQYDGKLLTMDITIISAKASVHGLAYRFIPIKIYEEYVLPEDLFAYYAVEYGADGQFLPYYTENITETFELIKTVTSEAHSITGVEVSYTSSNPNSILIDSTGDVPTFKVLNPGTATITIRATHAEVTYTKEFEVVVNEKESITILSIAEAIATADDTEVTVTGIIGASLVNKSGFYLVDETGLIAVEMLKDQVSLLNLGNKVTLKGIKKHVNTGGSTAAGQIAITEAIVLENELGNHKYNDSHFILDKTLADLMALDKLEDHTAQGYRITATVKNVKATYYENWYLTSGANEFRIYCGSGRQLSFLDAYADQEVVVEVALVNWNGKDLLLAIIAIVLPDGTKVPTDTNFR